MPRRKRIILLGATGSIGDSTLRVIRGNPDSLELYAIAANTNHKALAKIAREFGVRHVALCDGFAMAEARADFPAGTNLYTGSEGLEELATLPEGDVLLVAAVGTVGLKPTMAAIQAGKDIALASKEILVLAGKFVTEAAKRKGVRILPIDSEHNAIFQCLQGARGMEEVAKLLITASGGPFLRMSREEMRGVRPEDALKHPNWDMGPKITIDSSTMANKGLELIEARWLFGTGPERLQVVVHPQSIVHSMVEYVDGSIIAQLSPPSMTFAIQHSLLHPDRAVGVSEALDLTRALTLEFEPPDMERFPCLEFALNALGEEGTAPAIFNAANEVAVQRFIEGGLAYLQIPEVIARTFDRLASTEPESLEAVLEVEAEAKAVAAEVARRMQEQR